MQSLETAGFRARNWASVRSYRAATLVQVFPETMRCHALQVLGWPVWVGPGGVGAVLVLLEVVVVAEVVVLVVVWLVPTQYALPSQKLIEQSDDTAGLRARN